MRWTLPQDRIPEAWFNVAPHLPAPLRPPLHPATREPVGPDDLAPLFPMALIGQEMTTEPWVDVPGAVFDVLRLWRPTPLVRAERLEKALGTPARIYYKDESVSPAGSHKPNTAVPQAFYNHEEGVKRLTTETGAGQWGSALGFATCLFGMECKVYMVRASFDQKPYRRVMMETWGATVEPSPVDDPSHPGSLGSAISDAVRDAAGREDSHYSLGSVLNHVLLHQTVIGLEAKEQLRAAGEERPDLVVGCCGGGSNLGGLALPFVPDTDVALLAVEPSSCPTLTAGRLEYDFGDTAGMTPLLSMYTLGHEFIPLRYMPGGSSTTGTRRSSRTWSNTVACRRPRTPRGKSSRPPSSSPALRGRSQHRRPPTPYAPSSTRRSRRRNGPRRK
jgi:tryptophan synthase beta chain